MIKWLIGFALALGLGVSVSAQDTTPLGPVGTLEAGDFRALAVTLNGERLIVGDVINDQARVYDFSEPSTPRLLNAVDLDGTPVAVLGAEDFGLVAVTTRDAGLVQIIARPSYSRQYENYSTIDVTNAPIGMEISPSGHWAVVYGENGYTLLELLSADEINFATFEGDAIQAAALTDSELFLLPQDSDSIVTAGMQSQARILAAQELALPAAGRAIAVNEGETLGAVLLDNDALFLFNPQDMTELETLSLDGAFDHLRFVSANDAEWIVLGASNGDSLTLFDVSDPDQITPIGTRELQFPLTALTVFEDLIVVSSAHTVTIFSAQ